MAEKQVITAEVNWGGCFFVVISMITLALAALQHFGRIDWEIMWIVSPLWIYLGVHALLIVGYSVLGILYVALHRNEP